MLNIFYSKKYKRAIKKYSKSNKFDITWVEDVIFKIIKGRKLEEKYKDHQLTGRMKEYRECHIKPDLLLIYRIERNFILLIDIGSHSELFG